jgi:hypothetical protein
MVLKISSQSEITCLPDKQGAGVFKSCNDIIHKSEGDPL